MKRTKLFPAAGFIFLFPLIIHADRVILKNGQTLDGIVESQSEGMVYFKTEKGEELKIKKESVVSLIYDESKVTVRPKVSSTDQSPKENSVPARQGGIDREKITERVSVDRDLTDSVMKKFEDADKRRDNQIQKELELLREELKYLKEERDRLAKNNQDTEEFKKTMDTRMAGLEIRIRRLERYLAMDETMVEYYQSPRSPWDIVKRSAIFPGWGHRYAKEEYTGNAYSTSFIVLLALGYLVKYQADAAEEAVKDKFNGDIMLKSFQNSSLGLSNSTIGTTTLLSTYNSYEKSMNAVDSQKKLGSLLINGAIVLYGIQLVHAYFTGVDWAKSSPRDYSNESLLKSPVSWNFSTIPDISGRALEENKPNGIIYNLQISRRF